MDKVIFFSIIFSLSALAHPLKDHPFPKKPVVSVVEIDGVKESFVTSIDDRIMISKHCLVGRKLKCEAATALSRAFEKGFNLHNDGGKNPGSFACKLLKGEVLIAADEKGNQNTYCRFSDRSILDNGTLTFFTRNLAE